MVLGPDSPGRVDGGVDDRDGAADVVVVRSESVSTIVPGHVVDELDVAEVAGESAANAEPEVNTKAPSDTPTAMDDASAGRTICRIMARWARGVPSMVSLRSQPNYHRA